MIRYAFLLLLPAMQEPIRDDPEYKGWARCKPGSWVRIRTETEGLVMEATSTLKSVDENAALLEDLMTTTFQDQSTKEDKPRERRVERTLPAKKNLVVTKEGDEELTIASKKMACHWQVMENQTDGKKRVMKMWLCDGIPGGVAKGEVSGPVRALSRIVTGWEMK